MHFYFAHRTFVRSLFTSSYKLVNDSSEEHKAGFVPGLGEVSDRNFYKLEHPKAKGFLPTSFVKAVYRLDCFVKTKISASFLSVLPTPFKFLNI